MDLDAQKELFSDYMKLAGVPRLDSDPETPPELMGKRIGLVNSGAWMTLWGYFFARKHLPGVKVVQVGNEAVQLNFMQAHALRQPCPPQRNIELFSQYARQLVELAQVDAVMITCSTMNRCIGAVREALKPLGVPVVQIDEPMMRRAASKGGKILIVATHGPTVNSTRELLLETAEQLGQPRPDFVGVTCEEAFERLGMGDIDGHNLMIAAAIRAAIEREGATQAVLAQLSMSVFTLDYPDPVEAFGIPVFNSGDVGFAHMREVLSAIQK